MKKIIVLTTGGTIAMKYDEATGGLIPAVSGKELMAAVPALKELDCEIEVHEFSNVPSGHVTPQMMLDLGKMINQLAKDGAADGFVVTHGTDTLEETAYMLDLTVAEGIPVCVTGAMRGASETSPDGPGNILAAMQAVLTEEAKDAGTLVVLDDEIHAAAEVTKTHSTSTRTFASPFWGPLGRVYIDGVDFRRRVYRQKKIVTEKLEEKVYLLKIAAGMDALLFDCLIEKGAKGIVVEALGCGNVPPAVKCGITAARKAGIVVVLATRVHGGRVLPAYSYEGSAGSMKDLGLLLTHDLSGQKARLKLMLLLGREDKAEENLKEFF